MPRKPLAASRRCQSRRKSSCDIPAGRPPPEFHPGGRLALRNLRTPSRKRSSAGLKPKSIDTLRYERRPAAPRKSGVSGARRHTVIAHEFDRFLGDAVLVAVNCDYVKALVERNQPRAIVMLHHEAGVAIERADMIQAAMDQERRLCEVAQLRAD